MNPMCATRLSEKGSNPCVSCDPPSIRGLCTWFGKGSDPFSEPLTTCEQEAQASPPRELGADMETRQLIVVMSGLVLGLSPVPRADAKNCALFPGWLTPGPCVTRTCTACESCDLPVAGDPGNSAGTSSPPSRPAVSGFRHLWKGKPGDPGSQPLPVRPAVATGDETRVQVPVRDNEPSLAPEKNRDVFTAGSARIPPGCGC